MCGRSTGVSDRPVRWLHHLRVPHRALPRLRRRHAGLAATRPRGVPPATPCAAVMVYRVPARCACAHGASACHGRCEQVLFNAGVHSAELLGGWAPTVALLLEKRIPAVFTAFDVSEVFLAPPTPPRPHISRAFCLRAAARLIAAAGRRRPAPSSSSASRLRSTATLSSSNRPSSGRLSAARWARSASTRTRRRSWGRSTRSGGTPCTGSASRAVGARPATCHTTTGGRCRPIPLAWPGWQRRTAGRGVADRSEQAHRRMAVVSYRQ